MAGQDLSDPNPIIFQTGPTDNAGETVATEVNSNLELVYYTSQPNLQTLQPIPPEQLGTELNVTITPQQPELAEGSEEVVLETSAAAAPPIKKVRKKKDKEEQVTEKKKLEKRSKRLQKQLQQQRAEVRQQALQAREAALTRQAETETAVVDFFPAQQPPYYMPADMRYAAGTSREPTGAPQHTVVQASLHGVGKWLNTSDLPPPIHLSGR